MPTAEQTERLWEELETSLSELEEAEQEKFAAAARFDCDSLLAAVQRQFNIAERLADQIGRSRELLADDDSASPTEPTPGELGSTRSDALSRRRRLRAHASRVKMRLAADWLLTWRMQRCVSELLAVLAQARSTHGLVVDSTA
jgi:hypothetical protein